MTDNINPHRLHWLMIGIILWMASGCHHYRDRKGCCPTDLKETYGPFSSEAIRRAPCGPDLYNYGYKSTLWRCGPSEHPPSPAPCPDGYNWETQKSVPQAPPELAPIPSENMPPAPPDSLPAPSFPAENQSAVPGAGGARIVMPAMRPVTTVGGGIQRVSATHALPCNIPLRQPCNRLAPQCRVPVFPQQN